MIIDSHCHAGKGDGFNGPWDTEAKLGPHLARSRRAGIERTVVLPVFTTDYAAANARLARIVRAHAPALIGFASVHATRDAGRIDAMITRAVCEFGFAGLKVHGHDAMPTREVCDAARRYRLPLLVDIVGKPAVIEMLAGQYPDVCFIVPHLGAFADNWQVHLQVIDLMCRYPNVFGDTSGVRYWDALAEAVRRAGPTKLIWGSDGPYLHPQVELEKIRVLRLNPEAERLVLGGNMQRLLGRVRRPPPLDRRRELVKARAQLGGLRG